MVFFLRSVPLGPGVVHVCCVFVCDGSHFLAWAGKEGRVPLSPTGSSAALRGEDSPPYRVSCRTRHVQLSSGWMVRIYACRENLTSFAGEYLVAGGHLDPGWLWPGLMRA